MKINLLNSGYVMVSRALLMEVYGKQGAALTDEEAFLRVLVHVNYKSEKTCCGKDEVICQRGRVADFLQRLGGHLGMEPRTYPTLL